MSRLDLFVPGSGRLYIPLPVAVGPIFDERLSAHVAFAVRM